MLFSAFWAHLRKIEFLYSMQTWKELCDKLAISWLKLAKTWANWQLSYHMQGFQQPIWSGIPFPQTLANFPSNALIFSLKRSPLHRLREVPTGWYFVCQYGCEWYCVDASSFYPKSVIRISLCRTAKRNPLIFPI